MSGIWETLATPLSTEAGGLHVDDEQTQHQALRLLGLLEATDRHGNLQARLPITHWPVTVGRELNADLVLDDVHVSGRHLSLAPAANGHVTVQVLDTRNGVALGHRQHTRGEVFDWPVGQDLTIGRLHLRLRLAGTPVPAELPLPRFLWRATLGSLACVGLMLLLMLVQVWLKIGEPQNLLQQLPAVMSGAVAVLVVWSGLWALATKLFSGQAHFWRHVRIAALAFVVADLLEFVAQVLAFSFSWENVGRFSYLLLVLAAAVGIYRHLLVAAPQSRRGLALGVALVVLLGLPTTWGTQWLKNKRLSNQLYMAQMFPPNWRLAPAVPVSQFLEQAAGIERRLAARLKDKEDEEAADPSAGDDE